MTEGQTQERARHAKSARGAGVLDWGRRHRRILVIVSVVLLVVATYENSLGGVFAFDDKPNIVDNPGIRLDSLSMGDLYEASVARPLGQTQARPVAYASLSLNYYVGEYNVVGYHIVNIAIHCLTGIGFYLLLLMLLAAPRIAQHVAGDHHRIAAFATFLWLVHPLHVQAVTYIVQRMAAMAAMFAVWSMVSFLWAMSRRGAIRVAGFGLSGLLLLLAIGSKETAIIVPVLLALGPLLFGERPFSARRCAGYAAMAVAAGLAVLLLFQGPSHTVQMLKGVVQTHPEQLLTIPRAFFYSLSLVALPLPSRLNLDHHLPFSAGLFEPATTALALVGLLVVLVVPLLIARKRPLISAAAIWFLALTLLEAVAAKQDPVFEHRFYLPGLGLCLIAGLFFDWVARARNAAAATLAVALIVLAFAAASHRRNQVWLSETALWEDTVQKSPRKARGYGALTRALVAEGQLEGARRYYDMMTGAVPVTAMDHIALAEAAASVGELEAALGHLRRSLAVRPMCEAQSLYTVTLARLGRVAEANAALHVYEGTCSKQGWIFESTVAKVRSLLGGKRLVLENRIARNPGDLEAHFVLAAMLIREKNPEKALVHLEVVNRHNPRHVQVLENMGFCHYDLGRYDEAIEAHRRALAIDPKTRLAHYGLGQALTKRGEKKEAIASFRRFTELASPGDPFVAAALAQIAELE